jgi:hypothetical protein
MERRGKTKKSGTKAHAARVKASRKAAKGKKVEARGASVTEEFLIEETEDHKKTAEEKQFTLAQVTKAPGGSSFKVKFSEDGPDVTATMLAGAKLKGKKILNSNAATNVGDFVIALWSKEAESAHQKQGTEIKGKVPAEYIKGAKVRARQLGYSWPKAQGDELFEKPESASSTSTRSQSNSTRRKSRSRSRSQNNND